MKKLYFILTIILLVATNTIQAQNDSIYFWKEGQLIAQRSIKTADLDSITFKRPVVNPSGINIAGPNATDIDGNTYQSVTNCGQTWTKQNLNVSKYSDGTPIPQVTDPSQWQFLTTGAWCYYNNDPANEAVYGKLYNWYAVAGIYDAASAANPALRKKLAPTGWHVPTYIEWDTLIITCLGGEGVAGGMMKEIGTTHWLSPNTDATNSSGFTGLPGGSRGFSGTWLNFGTSGIWWTSSEGNTTVTYYRGVGNSSGYAGGSFINKEDGFSVRCVRD